MSFAFKGINFALAAILALFHDLFVVLVQDIKGVKEFFLCRLLSRYKLYVIHQ
jgi:preprotein translocase subunit SecF